MGPSSALSEKPTHYVGPSPADKIAPSEVLVGPRHAPLRHDEGKERRRKDGHSPRYDADRSVSSCGFAGDETHAAAFATVSPEVIRAVFFFVENYIRMRLKLHTYAIKIIGIGA
jgi:hypothetical protein